MWNIERDIHVQKMFMKRLIYDINNHYFSEFSLHFHLMYIIR